MAQTKSKSASGLGRDSQPKYLGLKLADGQKAKTGMVIIRQRGSKYLPGKNVGCGSDYTLYALKDGVVKFQTKNKTTFTGKKRTAKVVHVI
ncbi:MAG: 50S ribosomal protein L27 [Candidatus Pacebacteria bacterium]|nr:50S ribosomal protein L27 [Candidatus Paceibacterota bacterium]